MSDASSSERAVEGKERGEKTDVPAITGCKKDKIPWNQNIVKRGGKASTPTELMEGNWSVPFAGEKR